MILPIRLQPISSKLMDYPMIQGMKRFGRAVVLLLAAVGMASCGDSGQPQTMAPVFVSLPVQDLILKIDPQNGVVLERINVGRLPHHMVVDPEKRRLYAVLTGSQAVAEIDIDSGAVVRTMLTDAVPETRADGSRIDAHFEQDAFSHTNCSACHRSGPGGVKPAIVGSRPFAISLAADGLSLFVTNTRSASVSQIDLASGKLIKRMAIPGQGNATQPSGLARLDNRLVTSVLAPQPSNEDAVLRTIDLGTGEILHEATTGTKANFVVADPHRQQFYVANFETNTISVHGLAGELRTKYTVGPGPQGMQLTPDGKQLVVANYYDNSMSLISLDRGEVTTFPLKRDTQTFANPSHLVLVNDGATALVAASGTKGHLLRINLKQQLIESTLPIGPLPFDIAAAPASTH